jgi:hypothetical protein
MQTGPTVALALQSTERGVFFLKLPLDNSLQSVVRVIQEAGEAGFLKLLEAQEGEMRFRVHRSLAAYFGFSYRGSYYPVQLRGPDLAAIYQEVNLDKRNRLITEMVKSFNPIDSEAPLFGDPQ